MTTTIQSVIFKTEQDAIANGTDPQFFDTMGYKTKLMEVDTLSNQIKRQHCAQLKELLINYPQGQGYSPSLTTVKGAGSFLYFETTVDDSKWGWRMQRLSQDGREYYVRYSSWSNGNGNDCEGVYWIENNTLHYAPCVQLWNSYIRRHQGRLENGFGSPVAVC